MYASANFHDIAISFHPSNDMIDNCLVLCDGSLSSIIHLLLILQQMTEYASVEQRVGEILSAITDISDMHCKLIQKAKEEIKCEQQKIRKDTKQNVQKKKNPKPKSRKIRKQEKMARAKEKQKLLLKKWKLKQKVCIFTFHHSY